MERKEFLSKLGIGLAAVCAGCGMASCGSTPKADDPAPVGNNNNSGNTGNALFTANLASELTNVGEFKISNGVILVRLAQGNSASAFTAVQVACTHQGVSIGWNTAQGKFICPAHGSQFNSAGSVLQGPAALPLKQYNIRVSGSTLTVNV